MEPEIRIVVVEDEVLIAKHIENILNKENYNVVGVAHDYDSALDYIKNRSPDFLILDISLDGDKDGIQLAQIVKEKFDIPFMFLTALGDKATLDRAKRVNPSGYIIKPFTPRDLISSITIGLYNYEFAKKEAKLDLAQVNSKALQDLSQKEYEILLDISEGLTNAQIGKKQFVSLSTVKYHVQNIYSKLNVKNRTSAVKKILDL